MLSLLEMYLFCLCQPITLNISRPTEPVCHFADRSRNACQSIFGDKKIMFWLREFLEYGYAQYIFQIGQQIIISFDIPFEFPALLLKKGMTADGLAVQYSMGYWNERRNEKSACVTDSLRGHSRESCVTLLISYMLLKPFLQF